MNVKNLIRLLILIPLLMVLIGCGRKGPPTLPKEPSSLTIAIWNQREHKDLSCDLRVTSVAVNNVLNIWYLNFGFVYDFDLPAIRQAGIRISDLFSVRKIQIS